MCVSCKICCGNGPSTLDFLGAPGGVCRRLPSSCPVAPNMFKGRQGIAQPPKRVQRTIGPLTRRCGIWSITQLHLPHLLGSSRQHRPLQPQVSNGFRRPGSELVHHHHGTQTPLCAGPPLVFSGAFEGGLDIEHEWASIWRIVADSSLVPSSSTGYRHPVVGDLLD